MKVVQITVVESHEGEPLNDPRVKELVEKYMAIMNEELDLIVQPSPLSGGAS